jgi:hypothetical protein
MHIKWKWSTGEVYYKSEREQQNTNTKIEINQEYDSQINAINQSLADESFFNQDSSLINITNTMFSINQNVNETRREGLDTKMSEREMLAQRGINPFLQTSYVNDVVARDMFLKPVNTTFERSKEKNKDKSNDDS